MPVPKEVAKEVKGTYNGGSKIEIGKKGVSYDSGLEKAVGEIVEKIEGSSYDTWSGKKLLGGATGGGLGLLGGAKALSMYFATHPSPPSLVEEIGLRAGVSALGLLGLYIGAEVVPKASEKLYERKKTKIKEGVEEVPEKLKELKDYLHKQFASLPEIREDIRIPDAKAREIEKELVQGYNAYNSTNKVPILKGEGNKMKIVYKKL